MPHTLTRRRVLEGMGVAAVGALLAACSRPNTAAPVSPAASGTAGAPAGTTLNVRDFGAKGDGHADDANAVRAAVEAAITRGAGTTVLLPAGRYILGTSVQGFGRTIYTKAESGIDLAKTGYNIKAHVLIANASGLTITGEPGTLLVMKDATASGIALERCDGVTVRQIAIDYDPLPFSQGRITAANPVARTFEWKVDPDYLQPTQGFLAQSFNDASSRGFGYGNVFNDRGDLKFGAANGGDATIDDMTSAGGGVFRMKIAQALGDLVVGDRFAWPARSVGAGGHGMALTLCTDCRVEAVTIHAAPALAFAASDCDAPVFLNCVIERPANSARLYASNADGIHCKSARRGPLIEGCRFEHHGDDSVTVVQAGERLMGQPGLTEIIVEQSQYQLYRPGHRIAAITQATGLTTTEAKVVEVTLVRYKGVLARRITVDQPLRGLVSADVLGFATMPARAAGHDRATPLAKRPDIVADLDAVGTGFVLRNNVFANHRASGMRIYAAGGLVEGNHFENLGGHGLQIGMELAWPEVCDASNLTIRNNTFAGISNAANVWVHSLLGDYSQAQGMGNHDITIENNTFTGYGARLRGLPLAAVTVSNGRQVRIAGNTFTAPATGLSSPSEAVRLDLAAGITVQANTVAQPSATDPIVLTTRAEKASIMLADNRVTRG